MSEQSNEEVNNISNTAGEFERILKRNYKQIREDRAQTLIEDSELSFKRKIEDLKLERKKLTRDRDNMLDLSPKTTGTMTMPSDFDAQEFVEKDIEIGIKIRNLDIKIEIAEQRYNYLFGNLKG